MLVAKCFPNQRSKNLRAAKNRAYDVNLRDRLVRFRVDDVYFPDPEKLLRELHGNELLEGRVLDLSDGGGQEMAFAVVHVERVQQPVVVPVSRIVDST
jgi:hypothetical protein